MVVSSSRRRFLETLGSIWAGLQLSAIESWGGCLPRRASQDSNKAQGDCRIWFQEPARDWLEALPVGNGRMGAMIFGGISTEELALNEESLWSGYPRDWNNPGAREHLPIVRKLVLEDQNYHGADLECQKMQGPYGQAFEPLADLRVIFEHGERAQSYKRSLDIDSALASVSYEIDGCRYVREVFISAPDQVIVIRLTSSEAAHLNCEVRLSSPLRSRTVSIKSGEILLTGKAPSESVPSYLEDNDPIRYDEAPGKGMYFASILRAYPDGGDITATQEGSLLVKGATAVTLLVGAATGYRGYSVEPDLSLDEVIDAARRPVLRAGHIPYQTLLKSHVEDHQRLFRRAALELTPTNEDKNKPTNERLKDFRTDADPALLALYFNFGRYLLIASSRQGTLPANLQGIWNSDLRPPWSSNWTTNINVQMNYWPVETCNLSECHEPLFELLKGLSENGKTTASVNYGTSGWVSHHNVDLWRQSAPVGMGRGDPTWANFCMSGPWLCAHLWEHYLFTGDREFLQKTAYPIMRGSAEFLLDWVIENGQGILTTCPSFSTENSFLAPDGTRAFTSAGCTLDRALIFELFRNCQEASSILGLDHEFSKRLESVRSCLPMYKVGRLGQLQEWSVDFAESEPGQRHLSHLYPLYPGCEITPRRMPELAKAARRSIELRIQHGGEGQGWSLAWKVGLWARLGDGDMAWSSLQRLLGQSTSVNLFDTNAVATGSIFQIDGNLGATAAIAEMLLQSHDGEIALLPALPKEWTYGSVRGLRARGGLEVDLKWKRGSPTLVSIRAMRAGEHRIRAQKGCLILHEKNLFGQELADNLHRGTKSDVIVLKVDANQRYFLECSGLL